MPLTEEEMQAKLTEKDQTHATEKAAWDEQTQNLHQQVAERDEKIHALQERLVKFEKVEFDTAVDEYTHAVWEKLSDETKKKNPHLKDPKDFKPEEIHAVRNITKTFIAASAEMKKPDKTHTAAPSRSNPENGSETLTRNTAKEMFFR